MTLRVLCWNCRRAAASHELWQYFDEISPDVALLQEVSSIPADLARSYAVRSATPITRSGALQRFQSALLVRGHAFEPLALRSGIDWVDSELERFAANLLAYRVSVPGLAPLAVVDVYSPAWPVARERLAGVDLMGVKLTQNPDVWVTDLLVAALSQRAEGSGEWIVGGDFNACETFDNWRGGPRGNREWLDRMTAPFSNFWRPASRA
jgi:exonuclease III